MTTTPYIASDNNAQAINIVALGNLYTLQSVLQQLYININLIENGVQGKIITVTNANLYALAAQYYGDATQWTTIAEANGLDDPYIENTIQVELGANGIGNAIYVSGVGSSQQTLSLSITNLPYTAPGQYITASYTMIPTDDLTILCKELAEQIPNATADQNSILLPSISSLNLPVTVATPTRYLNLTIPQQAGTPSGGVLVI
jgi:hypothetical protein